MSGGAMHEVFTKEQELIADLGGDAEISVWLDFMFQLTIAGRSFANDARELGQINEVNHRILNRIRDLRDGEKWSTAEYTIGMIEEHVSTAPAIHGHISRAFRVALKRST